MKILSKRNTVKNLLITNNIKNIFHVPTSGGKGSEYVLIKNGLDSICKECVIKHESLIRLASCSAPDDRYLDLDLIKQLDLKEGEAYPIKQFLEKIKHFAEL